MFSYARRRTRGRRRTAVAVLCAVVLGLAAPGARAGEEPRPPAPAAGREARQAATFWTAQR
ncbi:hypothetical protein ACWEOA_24295, partial [Streptomyces sp. NPDC004457]